jgi:hypothetical protein
MAARRKSLALRQPRAWHRHPERSPRLLISGRETVAAADAGVDSWHRAAANYVAQACPEAFVRPEIASGLKTRATYDPHPLRTAGFQPAAFAHGGRRRAPRITALVELAFVGAGFKPALRRKPNRRRDVDATLRFAHNPNYVSSRACVAAHAFPSRSCGTCGHAVEGSLFDFAFRRCVHTKRDSSAKPRPRNDTWVEMRMWGMPRRYIQT